MNTNNTMNQKSSSPNSKYTSQLSFEDNPPIKTESYDFMDMPAEDILNPSPYLKLRKLAKPKTEILFSPLSLPKEDCTEEEIKPIIERRKIRETSTKEANPFINLKRFSSKTWIMHTTACYQDMSISPLKKQKPEEFLKISLKSHFLFKEWDPFLLEKLISELRCIPLNKNELLIDKNTPIRSFYVIAEGSILIKHEEVIEVHGPGELLCISAIFQPMELGYSIESNVENTILWGLEFVKFQEILKNNAYSALQENRRYLDRIQYFENLSKENKIELAFYLKTMKFVKNDIILTSGQINEHLYIVKSGIISIYSYKDDIEKPEGFLKEKEIFGEDKYEGDISLHTIKVEESEEAILLRISKKTLKLLLGTQYSRMIHVNELRIIISRSPVLIGLDPIMKERIIKKLKVSELKKGDIIWEKKQNNRKLLFLLRGEIWNENETVVIKKKGIFDEESLLEENIYEFNELKMGTDGIIAEITFDKLAVVLKTTNIQEYFLILRKAFKKEAFDLGSPISPFIHIKSVSMALKNCINDIRRHQRYELVRILKEIGDGQFGLVLLAKIEDRYFALKLISRLWVIQNSIEDYLVNEKKICRMIDSPFIIHLDFTFRDEYNIYFLFEYIEGLDLFKFMNITGIIPTPLSKFYAANLILAIEYLHNKNIIHRDLKPENIMISKNGYLKVIDLGAAKLLGEETYVYTKGLSSAFANFHKSIDDDSQSDSHIPLKRTYTLIGTPEYLAPETIKGTGYHFPVDLWALGVIIFEMLCGYCPFGHNKSEPMEIYQSILEDELKFPKFMKDSKAKKLIRQLLSKNSEERSEGSFNALKAARWFDDIKWNDIGALKNNIPPYIPENKESENERQSLLEKGITLKYVLENSALEELKNQPGIINESNVPGWDDIF